MNGVPVANLLNAPKLGTEYLIEFRNKAESTFIHFDLDCPPKSINVSLGLSEVSDLLI